MMNHRAYDVVKRAKKKKKKKKKKRLAGIRSATRGEHVHDGEIGVRLVLGDALGELDALGEPGARLDHVVRQAERPASAAS